MVTINHPGAHNNLGTKKTRFVVLYSVASESSMDEGEYEESGVVDSGNSLVDAVKDFNRTRTNEVDSPESYSADYARNHLTVTVNNSPEYKTGDRETRSLIARCTRSSAARILRVMKIDVPCTFLKSEIERAKDLCANKKSDASLSIGPVNKPMKAKSSSPGL